MPISCPVCLHIPDGDYHIQVDKYSIFKCESCGLEFTFPLPTDAELSQFYTNYQEQYYNNIVKQLNAYEARSFMINHGIERDARLLDYGCGNNDFAREWGYNAVGYDPYRNITNLDDSYYGYDVITMFGVLEHLIDPIGLMQELINDLLMRDGCLVNMFIVNDSGIPYRYKPPEHLTYWTKQAYEILCNKCGLELIAYEPFSMYERLSVLKEKMGRKLPAIVREKAMPINDGDEFDYVLVPTNNVITIAKKGYNNE